MGAGPHVPPAGGAGATHSRVANRQPNHRRYGFLLRNLGIQHSLQCGWNLIPLARVDTRCQRDR